MRWSGGKNCYYNCTMSDRDPDYYKMMDQAGLTAPDILNTREPIQTIINRVRTSLVLQLKEYVEKIEGESD